MHCTFYFTIYLKSETFSKPMITLFYRAMVLFQCCLPLEYRDLIAQERLQVLAQHEQTVPRRLLLLFLLILFLLLL